MGMPLIFHFAWFLERLVLKTTRPGHHLSEVTIAAYEEPELCLLTTIGEYLRKTKDFRTSVTNQLFLTTIKPHKPVSRDTISRWIKLVIKQSGLDVTIYTPHSTRSATTSAAKNAGLPMTEILKSAGWTNENTFYRFYHKLIQGKQARSGFSESILKSV